LVVRQLYAVARDNFRATHSVHVVEIDIVRVAAPFNRQNGRLALLVFRNPRAVGRVVVEERVQAYSVAENVVAAEDTQTPAGCSAGGRRVRSIQRLVCEDWVRQRWVVWER